MSGSLIGWSGLQVGRRKEDGGLIHKKVKNCCYESLKDKKELNKIKETIGKMVHHKTTA